MTDVIRRAFGINLKLLWICRLYDFEESTTLFRFQIYFIYIFIIILLPSLIILNLFMKDELDIRRVNYDAAIIAETTCCIAKFLPLITNTQEVRKCINNFELFFSSKKLNCKQRKILDEGIDICRKSNFIYLTTIIGGFISVSIRPLFWKGYELPIDLWLPFDFVSTAYTFYMVYLFVTACILYLALATAVLDPLIGGLACLVSCQLKILQDNLENLDSYAKTILKNKKSLNDLDANKIIYGQIQRCVLHHNEIICFTQEFEKCFSISILSEIVAAVFIICFSCLQLSRLEISDISTIYQMGSYFFAVIAPMYFYCSYGSAVSEESSNIVNAIYMSNWYNYDIKSKKALGIVMARAQKPIYITSGKIIELSLETFAVILKRTYSLLTLLKNYYQ